MKNQSYFNGKRLTGIGLILFSAFGIILFKFQNWGGETFFYLSLGWGLAMLI